jgi:hypothetical protein
MVALLVSTVPALAKKDNHIVQILNEQLGKTESEMATWTWDSSIEQLQDGRKRLIHFIAEPVFLSSPGQQGYTESTTSGQVDRRGNISLDTTTIDHPPTDPIGLYLHIRTIFYFNSEGKVYRWEAYGGPTYSRNLDEYDKAHLRWELLDARELRVDRKGRTKAVKVGDYQGFWWLAK